MSLIYILLSLIFIIVFILIKKTNKKENILLWATLSIVLFMCFNIFITLIFNAIKIKSTLTNLSIVQICLIIKMLNPILRKKEIQKYYIKKTDIIMSAILAIIVAIIAIVQYGIPFSIKYIITDGSTHYLAAVSFYEKSDLLKLIGIEDFTTFMTGAYVNCGILLKSLSSIITTKDFYTVFVIFDLIVLLLSGMLFYLLVSSKANKKSEYVLAYIFTILYLLGYAVNSTLSGFCYLLVGLDIILAIVLLIRYIDNKNNALIITSMSLLMLGLFFSYYFFAPVVYLSVFIYLIKKRIDKNEKIISASSLTEVLYILAIPALFGMYYMFLRGIITQDYNVPTDSIKIKGDIYSNIITNFIVFIPLMFIYVYKGIKSKKNDVLIYMLISEILFIILLAIGMKFGMVSEYYFYKAYYLLWILALCTGFQVINSFKKVIAYVITAIYVIGLIVSVGVFKQSAFIYDIYKYNFENLADNHKIVDYQQLDLVEYYCKNIKEQINELEDVYIFPSLWDGRSRWMYVLYKNISYSVFDEECNSIEYWLENKEEKYFIYYKEDLDNYEPDENSNQYEILINNESGAILKRK